MFLFVWFFWVTASTKGTTKHKRVYTKLKKAKSNLLETQQNFTNNPTKSAVEELQEASELQKKKKNWGKEQSSMDVKDGLWAHLICLGFITPTQTLKRWKK